MRGIHAHRFPPCPISCTADGPPLAQAARRPALQSPRGARSNRGKNAAWRKGATHVLGSALLVHRSARPHQAAEHAGHARVRPAARLPLGPLVAGGQERLPRLPVGRRALLRLERSGTRKLPRRLSFRFLEMQKNKKNKNTNNHQVLDNRTIFKKDDPHVFSTRPACR